MLISNRSNARLENVLTKDVLAAISFRDLAEMVTHEWVEDRNVIPEVIGSSTSRRFMSHGITSGHWFLKCRIKCRHVMFSTVLYNDRPCFYELMELGDSTTQRRPSSVFLWKK